MADTKHYVIRGGVEGRERLRILSRVMHATTMTLLERFEIHDGMTGLDVGCGGGDVTMALARLVGPRGRVLGVDMDAAKLDLARSEAAAQGIANIEFRSVDIRAEPVGSGFDLVYARFLLTHLDDPARILTAFSDHLRPGGLVIVEDIDFSGLFTWPESRAARLFHDLYVAVVKTRRGDANIGPRLPILLAGAGFETIGVNVVQPIAMQGEAKLINPITLASIADAVVEEGLASREDIETAVRELHAFAADPATVAGMPRVVQAWGRRSGD